MDNSFQTLTTKFSTSSMIVDIQNLEISASHWKSSRHIISLAEELDTLSWQSIGELDWKNIFMRALLAFNRENQRITDMLFYDLPDVKFAGEHECRNALICLCISDIPTLNPDNFLKRTVIIDFELLNKAVIFQDISKEEWENREKKIPMHWQFDKSFTNRFMNYKKMFM